MLSKEWKPEEFLCWELKDPVILDVWNDFLADWKAIHSMFPPWSYGLPKLCGDSWLPVAASICWLQQSTTFELGMDRFQNIHRVSWRLRQICWRNHRQSWSAELSWLHKRNLTRRSGSRLLRVLGVGRWSTMRCNKWENQNVQLNSHSYIFGRCTKLLSNCLHGRESLSSQQYQWRFLAHFMDPKMKTTSIHDQ